MEQNGFKFTYSAPTEAERREIAGIRQQYEEPEKAAESGLVRLRRLDAFVTGSSTAAGLALGIVGCLVFGLGLAMILEWGMLFLGILTAAVGALPMLLAYPLYRKVLKSNRKKYGPEILRLSEELLQGGRDE